MNKNNSNYCVPFLRPDSPASELVSSRSYLSHCVRSLPPEYQQNILAFLTGISLTNTSALPLLYKPQAPGQINNMWSFPKEYFETLKTLLQVLRDGALPRDMHAVHRPSGKCV